MGRRQEDEFEDRLKKIVELGADATSEEWLKIIEREYGKVPLIFQRMGERPEVLISHLLYKSSVAETSSLDPKYVELISMAVGAALKCQYCTSYHMQAAARMGATRDEILEVILLSGMIANSSVLANAYRVIDERLEKCFPCEVNAVKEEPAAQKKTKTPAPDKSKKRSPGRK